MPAQSSSSPSGSRRSAGSPGRSEYSIISWRPSRTTTSPTFSAGSVLRTTFDDISAPRRRCTPRKAGVADRDEGVVDLEVEDRADPAVGHLGERAAPVERPDRAAVPVGRERDPAPLGQQDPAGRAVDRGHLALDEEAQTCSTPNASCSSKNAAVAAWFCGLVITYSGTETPWRAPSATTFSAWIWNSGRSVTGPIG